MTIKANTWKYYNKPKLTVKIIVLLDPYVSVPDLHQLGKSSDCGSIQTVTVRRDKEIVSNVSYCTLLRNTKCQEQATKYPTLTT